MILFLTGLALGLFAGGVMIGAIGNPTVGAALFGAASIVALIAIWRDYRANS